MAGQLKNVLGLLVVVAMVLYFLNGSSFFKNMGAVSVTPSPEKDNKHDDGHGVNDGGKSADDNKINTGGCPLPTSFNIASDLLPKVKQDGDNDFIPPTPPIELQGNFLDSARCKIGVDTVGQSLRNANYGLRSEPPCPRVQVSPWNISTITPDLMRRDMEIDGCQYPCDNGPQ